MEMCPQCGSIAYRNAYHGVIQCHSCNWICSIKEYDRERQTPAADDQCEKKEKNAAPVRALV